MAEEPQVLAHWLPPLEPDATFWNTACGIPEASAQLITMDAKVTWITCPECRAALAVLALEATDA